ncbi:hypothetical protein I5L01_15320 [Erythrobacter sp. YJ-T3-07]|nr:hypothetical protein [Erythrobacter sp. YJ-T3-07]
MQARSETPGVLEARGGLDLKIGQDVKSSVTCPETNNNNFPHQDQHVYTTNQIKQAFLKGAKLAAAGQSLGVSKFFFPQPHDEDAS